MKSIYKSLLAVLAVAPLATGCIEEVYPTGATTSQEQLVSNTAAAEALSSGMPAYMNKYNALGLSTDDVRHYDWGHASVMHVLDVMTADMAIAESGYDHYQSWETCTYQGDGYIYGQFLWNYMNGQVKSTNDAVGGMDPEPEAALNRFYLASALVFRASTYLDFARMYEFVPNKYTQMANPANNHLTVPITTQETSEAQARENPRVQKVDMIKFIKGDLDRAIELYDGAAERASKTLPDLSVCYGVYARLCMWSGEYEDAAKYARLAITSSGATPLTKDQWLSTTNGFNNINTPSWMWGIALTQEDRLVTSALLNWTSWMAPETTFGYASAGPMAMISKSLYDRMDNRDFRKLSYLAPEGSSLYGATPLIDADFMTEIEAPTYTAVKFRPGAGNMEDNKIACAVGVPLMRVEEMYLIEAEALAHNNAAAGRQALIDFVRTFRYPEYTCMEGDAESIVNAVFEQKRIELWGEGLIFFDYKRLDKGVTRYYEGTNFYEDAQFNTDGMAPWMNIVAVKTEQNNNSAFINNPDPEVIKPVPSQK